MIVKYLLYSVLSIILSLTDIWTLEEVGGTEDKINFRMKVSLAFGTCMIECQH